MEEETNAGNATGGNRSPSVSIGDPLSNEQILILAETRESGSEEDKEIRAALWAQFLPYLIAAVILYMVLSVGWILWNVYAYRRDLRKAQKGQFASRLHEKWRLLSVYDQIPIPEPDADGWDRQSQSLQWPLIPTPSALQIQMGPKAVIVGEEDRQPTKLVSGDLLECQPPRRGSNP